MIDTQANGAFPNLTDVFEENPTEVEINSISTIPSRKLVDTKS